MGSLEKSNSIDKNNQKLLVTIFILVIIILVIFIGIKILFPNLKDFLSFVKDTVLIIGGIIGFFQFYLQQNQRRIDNSLRLIDKFRERITEEKIKVFKDIFFSSMESCGVEEGHFLYNGESIPLDNLFIQEGSGSIYDKGIIRDIAEELDFIAYQILEGNIDFYICYRELGTYFEIIYNWIIQVQEQNIYIAKIYKYILKMYKLKEKDIDNIEVKNYFSGC